MKQAKSIIILVVGVCVGLWFGVNIGKEKSIFNNPFADVALQNRIKQTSKNFIKKSGDLIEKGGQRLEQSGMSIKNKVRENEDK